MSDPRQGSPDHDVALARQALAQRDLPHALHHIGCALTHDPMHRERMSLLNEIIAAAPEPMKLVELDGNVSFVDAANRAYVLAWQRRWSEAMDLITDVAEIRPDIPYMLWCEWWLAQPGILPSLPLAELISGIVVDILKIASKCPTPIPADDPRKPTVESGARILAAIRAAHPGEGLLWFGSSMVARRVGAAGEALGFAQHAYQLDPSWKAAIGVANALRDAGQLDEAARWFARARQHDPKDVSAFLDCGDMMLDAERHDEAAAQYEAATKLEPDHPWATASLTYLHYLRHRDPGSKLALLRLTEAEPANHRAEDLYAKLDPPRLYLNRLPHPADASANALNAIFEEMYDNPAQHHGSTVKLKLTHVESPSVVAAFWLQMEMWGAPGRPRLSGRAGPDAGSSSAQGPGAIRAVAVGRHPAAAGDRSPRLRDRDHGPRPGQRAFRPRRVGADGGQGRGQARRRWAAPALGDHGVSAAPRPTRRGACCRGCSAPRSRRR
jgi:tetratricopeptide (TPR) repeat protein